MENESAADNLFERYVQTVYPSKEHAKELIQSDRKLTFYLGIDPTGPHIHIGHSTNLLWLKKLHNLGHTIILLIGDFTARIGDPTDKSAARTALSEEEVGENMKMYLNQIEKILAPGTFTVRYNSEWLAPLNFEGVIRLASHVTVQQMIQRDMFQERIKQEKPIYVHEFFYPLMQGYDSVAMQVDGEVGGNDQTFNMLMGRDLESKLLGKDKLVVTTKLLEHPETGKKIMNKSEGTVIALDDSPQEIRRKILALDDTIIATVFELCTEVPLERIEKLRTAEPRQLKEILSDELIRMYHGEGGVDPSRAPIDVEAPIRETLLYFVREVAGAPSMARAKELITNNAVRVNGNPETNWDYKLKSGDRVQVGKGKFYEVK